MLNYLSTMLYPALCTPRIKGYYFHCTYRFSPLSIQQLLLVLWMDIKLNNKLQIFRNTCLWKPVSDVWEMTSKNHKKREG
jgi:hypothetical protein